MTPLSHEEQEKDTVVPTIDFGPFMVDEGVVVNQPPTAAQIAVAEQIHQACVVHGFVYLTNFGLLSLEERQQAATAAKELFAQPNNLTRLRRLGVTDNKGYAPYASETHNPRRPPELSEKFNIRFAPAHENDFTGCPAGFVDICRVLLERLPDVARRYALACATALQLRHADFFARTLRDMNQCTIRFLHAPPCDYRTSATADLTQPVRVGEHTDFGAFTFLLIFQDETNNHNNTDTTDTQGFQFQPVAGGEMTDNVASSNNNAWKDLKLPHDIPNGAIVNTGALLARWTNDEWKATAHRVVVKSPEMANRHRYSMAFFADPDVGTLIDVPDELLVTDKNGTTETTLKHKVKKYPPTTSDAYLLEKLRAMDRGEHPDPQQTSDQ